MSAIIGGALLAFAFPPLPFWGLAFAGFVPLLDVIERGGKTVFASYVYFFVFCGITTWWIGSWSSGADPYLMMAGGLLLFVQPLFFLIPIAVYKAIRSRFDLKIALFFFPFIWTAYEWSRSLGDLAFPWLSIGYSQTYDVLWSQVADLAGVWGAGFLIAAANAFLFYAFEKYREGAKKKALKPFLAFSLLVVAPFVYGAFRYASVSDIIQKSGGKTYKIGIVQTNVNPWRKWEVSARELIRRNLAAQDSALKNGRKADLYLWSETAIPFASFRTNAEKDFGEIAEWAAENDAFILTGFAEYRLYKKGEKPGYFSKRLRDGRYYDVYNSAALIEPGKRIAEQVHRKMKLTPFSERLPYREIFGFAKKWLEWGVGISSWEKGKIQKPLKAKIDGGVLKIGAIICIESVFPNFVRKYVAEGADLLAIITNDSWYDHTFGPEQHFSIARFRAIETRRYVARCANSGLSGIIDPLGKPVYVLPQYKYVCGVGEIKKTNFETLYVRWGDWLPIISAAIALSGFAVAIFKRRKFL